MKKSISLREHAANVTTVEKKKMLPLTEKAENTSRFNSMLHLQKENSHKSLLKIKIVKLETIAILQVHIEAQHSISNLRFKF